MLAAHKVIANQQISLLLVTPDDKIVKLFKEFLSEYNSGQFNLINANSLKNTLSIINTRNFNIVILDLTLPDSKGIETFKKISNKISNVPIVILSEPSNDAIGIQCLRLGASDYLLKNHLQNGFLIPIIYYLLKRTTDDASKGYVNEFIGKSNKIQEVLRLIKCYAATSKHLLILGESGTGKDKAAEMIHILSKRKSESFIKINCANLPKNLLKYISERCKNITTSTRSLKDYQHSGISEGVTIFLNEIGNISLAIQREVLDILEKSNIKQNNNVRIILATNRNIEAMAVEEEFKKFISSKIKPLILTLPPLRDRVEDIPLLVNHFIGIYSKKFNRPITNIESEVLAILIKHKWPGNVRELRYTIKYACATTGENIITVDNLPLGIIKAAHSYTSVPQNIINREKNKILKVLEETNWNRTKTAKIIGISRSTLWHKMKLYNIHKKIIY